VSSTHRARPGTLASCSTRRRCPRCLPDLAHPFLSPSSLSLLAEKTEPPLPLPLRRARTRSPPCHRASKLATSSALSPSTPSSHPCPQTHHGKATLPFPPPRDLTGVRPRDGSPWPAQHRVPLLFLALVPSSLSPVDALVKMLPQMPAKPGRNTAAHCRAMAADEVLMWPCYSTPSRSSLVA
jgi:hypothetical protein